MKKLTSILALSTLAFSVSAMANSTDFGTAAENFIDNYNARSAFGTYSQVSLNGTNCSNNIVPVEGYDVTGGAAICYDGLQNLKDGTAYIEYTTNSAYGNGNSGYLVYLKDKLTNVNVKLTDKSGNNVPASTLNLEGVYDSQDGSKTVIFLKSQDPLYNRDNIMDGQISISGTVVGVDAALATAEFEAAVKQVSKDALNEDMQKIGYFAGSGAEAISLLVDDKTQQAVSGFALKTELPDVSGFASLSDLPDLTGYALITQLPDLSGYAKSSEIPSLTGYALKSELPDLSPYALKTEIPSTAGLATTAYVSTIKDLATTADTKATTAGNTANEALTAVQAIDLQAVINRLETLEQENEVLKAKKSPFEQVFHVQETYPTGSRVGDIYKNKWTLKKLNYSPINHIGAIINSNGTVTVPAGKYWVEFHAGAHAVHGYYSRLYNVTDNVWVESGNSGWAGKTGAINSKSTGYTEVTFNKPTTLKVEVYVMETNVDKSKSGQGLQANRKDREVYSELLMFKLN
jgi:hypothetical protein